MIRRYCDKQFRPSIRLTVVTIFVLATVLTAVLAVGLQYYFSRNMATETAVTQFDGMASRAGEFLDGIDKQAVQATRLLASYPGLVNNQWVQPEVRQLFAEYLKVNPIFYAIYVGFDNGDFYELINLDCCNTFVRQQYNAQPDDRWVIVSIRGSGGSRTKTQAYYDQNFQLRYQAVNTSRYNASTRPWFVHAVTDNVNKTKPYWFELLQAPGQTYSLRVKDAQAVIAVDIALFFLSDYLKSHSIHGGGELYLYQQNGDMVASDSAGERHSSLPPVPPLALTEDEKAVVARQGMLKVSNENDWAPIDFAVSGRPEGYSIDYLSLISQMTGVQFEYVNGFSWNELKRRFSLHEIDLLQPVFLTAKTQHLGLASQPFLTLPYSLVTQPDSAALTHLQQLNGKSLAIPEGWSIIPVIKQAFPQISIKQVASGREVLEAVRQGQADAGLDSGEILHYTGKKYFYSDLQYHDNIQFAPFDFPQQLHFIVQADNSDLLPILNKAIAAVPAEQIAALKKKWFAGKERSTGLGTVPYQQLISLARQPELQKRLNQVRLNGKENFVYVVPLGSEEGRDEYLAVVMPVKAVLKPALREVSFSILLTSVFLLVLLPTPWLFAAPIVAPIKALARANEKIRLRKYDQLHIPDSHIKEISELGTSIRTMADSIQEYEENQRKLMDSFIQLIAQAIDEKSPYTGGHCNRVPELAFMLAEKAGDSQAPPFAEFCFKSEDEWREFRIGAWLHDCGKITTPLHIVDKGTKLETICNRIHEIRTRFEVLLRDAEIHYLHQLLSDPAGKGGYEQDFNAVQQRLQDDFAFVAGMNTGSEFLDDGKKERLQEIAEQTWTRNFSNRLGLSPPEEKHLKGEEILPCEERLLDDKSEHIIPRERKVSYKPELGIRLDVPEHLANQGELYNLLIERGTLTAEDRFRINEHTISTIRMLDALPLPNELARVPQYASTHHETIKGDGYPRKLKGDRLSMPERIMVLADIFEALTASDRPYQKAKSVSVAIDILYHMVEDEHVDRDVFELFLKSGTYLDYARRFLPSEQIDAVDIDNYLRRTA